MMNMIRFAHSDADGQFDVDNKIISIHPKLDARLVVFVITLFHEITHSIDQSARDTKEEKDAWDRLGWDIDALQSPSCMANPSKNGLHDSALKAFTLIQDALYQQEAPAYYAESQLEEELQKRYQCYKKLRDTLQYKEPAAVVLHGIELKNHIQSVSEKMAEKEIMEYLYSNGISYDSIKKSYISDPHVKQLYLLEKVLEAK